MRDSFLCISTNYYGNSTGVCSPNIEIDGEHATEEADEVEEVDEVISILYS